MLQHTIQGVLIAGGSATLGFMLYAGEPSRPLWWLAFAVFATWGLIPFACVAAVARRFADSRGSLRVLLLAAVLLSIGNAFLLYEAFVAQPDAQSGLVFIFLPMWQLVALIPFLAIARALRSPGNGLPGE